MTNPKNWAAPMHPGELLKRRFFTPMGISQSEFSKKYGIEKTKLHRLFKGEVSITADTANEFSIAFDMSPMFFMNLQSQYDLAKVQNPDAFVLSDDIMDGEVDGSARHAG